MIYATITRDGTFTDAAAISLMNTKWLLASYLDDTTRYLN